MDSHPLLLSKESAAGNAGGRLCPLHQPVPWLRAADADGPPIALLLHPGYHGRIQRSVNLPPGFQKFKFKTSKKNHFPWVYGHPILCMICNDLYEHSPCFVSFRDVQGQKWAAEDSHLYGPLPWDGSNVCEAICWYLSTHSYQISLIFFAFLA